MNRILWSFLAAFAFTTAHAASFDCARAKSQLEKIICANAPISAYDEELAKSYDAAMKLLSPEGRAILKRGQIEWIHHINFVCITHHDPAQKMQTPAWCVEQKYKSRVGDMTKAAVRIGPYLFSRIDYFCPNRVDEDGRPYDGQTSYPRIDSPIAENTKKWNGLMARGANAKGGDYCDGEGDVWVGFTIQSATEKYISVTTSDWAYCHGKPHGLGDYKGVTFFMQPEPRAITSEDLFGEKNEWKAFVTDKCFADLTGKADGTAVDRNRVAAIATSPRAWSITHDGLVITFNPYDVLGYAFGTTNVLIPWKELQPFLISKEIIPQTH